MSSYDLYEIDCSSDEERCSISIGTGRGWGDTPVLLDIVSEDDYVFIPMSIEKAKEFIESLQCAIEIIEEEYGSDEEEED